jgi:hypothetical protein
VGLRRAIVVTEKATDALTSPNAAPARLNSVAVDQFVAEPLMIAFAMIMDDELRECTTKVPLTERNHAVQAFLLDRSNKPLRMRIGVSRRLHRLRAVRRKPFRVTHPCHPVLCEYSAGREVRQL